MHIRIHCAHAGQEEDREVLDMPLFPQNVQGGWCVCEAVFKCRGVCACVYVCFLVCDMAFAGQQEDSGSWNVPFYLLHAQGVLCFCVCVRVVVCARACPVWGEGFCLRVCPSLCCMWIVSGFVRM